MECVDCKSLGYRTAAESTRLTTNLNYTGLLFLVIAAASLLSYQLSHASNFYFLVFWNSLSLLVGLAWHARWYRYDKKNNRATASRLCSFHYWKAGESAYSWKEYKRLHKKIAHITSPPEEACYVLTLV